MTERAFPVLMSPSERRQFPDAPASVPWAMLAPHDEQARKNHGQSLDRLAERGGLCPTEMLWILDGVGWEGATWRAADAVAELVRRASELRSRTAGQ